MASQPYTPTLQLDTARAAVAEIKQLTVDRLKRILRHEGLTVSGIKTELQVRLIGFIEQCAAANDFTRIERIRASAKGGNGFPNHYPSPYSNPTPSSSLSPQFASPAPRMAQHMTPYPMATYSPARLAFKFSPFYDIIRPLSSVMELKAREQTRDTARINLRLSNSDIENLTRDMDMKIMVFCAAESIGPPTEARDIAFPQHGELKCNSDEVKHNLKGMKGKAGTTRPADITQFIRKSTAFVNTVEMVYALTSKKYFLVINFVRKMTAGRLIAEILRRDTPFTKDQVIRQMRSKADDPDIVATSTIMSLKDPLQMTRIQTPCRGLACTHNGCFDASVFLALQEQAPTWTCPLCHKPVTWENIFQDQYFADILRNVDGDLEQVTVEPDGRWHKGSSRVTDDTARGPQTNDDDDSDDDVIEVIDSRSCGPPSANSASNTLFANRAPSYTPSTSTSAADPSSNSRSNKRPHSETIDLTLDDSDDDDQPPVQRIKRPSISSQSSMDPYQVRTPQSNHVQFRVPPQPPYGQSRPSGF